MTGDYKAEDPQLGDLVILKGVRLDTTPKELESKAGVITMRLGPDHGGLVNYVIEVIHANGFRARAHSQDYRCFKTMERMTANLLESEKLVHEKLDTLAQEVGVNQGGKTEGIPKQRQEQDEI